MITLITVMLIPSNHSIQEPEAAVSSVLAARALSSAELVSSISENNWLPTAPNCSTAPGSATDLLPRTVFEHVAASVGQPIIIENVGGAGGMIDAGEHRHVALGECGKQAIHGVACWIATG